MAFTMTPAQKKIAIGVAILIAAGLVYWFFFRKDEKKDEVKDPAAEATLKDLKSKLAKCLEENKNVRVSGDPCKDLNTKIAELEKMMTKK